MKAPKTAHPHILPSTYYPETTVLPNVKDHESSLVEQIKYQLKYKKARHITNNIYQFRLSKTKETMDYPSILEQLKDFNIEIETSVSSFFCIHSQRSFNTTL